jgi:hypothetical protein
MAAINDSKIKTLLKAIEDKKDSLGTKPKGSLETNCVINGRNLHTVITIDGCVSLASELMLQKGLYDQACTFLDVDGTSDLVKGIDDALKDVKLRVQMIKWDNEKKKLSAMEKQLKDLRSEDLKTEDALATLEADLGI